MIFRVSSSPSPPSLASASAGAASAGATGSGSTYTPRRFDRNPDMAVIRECMLLFLEPTMSWYRMNFKIKRMSSCRSVFHTMCPWYRMPTPSTHGCKRSTFSTNWKTSKYFNRLTGKN